MKNINGSIETSIKDHAWCSCVGTVSKTVSMAVWNYVQVCTLLSIRDRTWFAFQNKLWKI